MVILRTRNKITDFLMILAWASPFKNERHSAILDFISAKFIMGYPCVSPYILFYMHGPAILL